MFPLSVPESDPSDGFDRLPDPLILLIFDRISDVKTLIRCRSVSKRFNNLVPESESLLLRVDRVISESESDSDSILFTFLRSIFKSIHSLISPKQPPLSYPTRIPNSPTQILIGFKNIRILEISLPTGDFKLDTEGAVIRWRAEYGKSLKGCVVFGYRKEEGEETRDEGLKMRALWTISALIASSMRHHMVLDVVREQKGLERLVVRDREGEGVVFMDKDGLRECREWGGDGVDVGCGEEGGVGWVNNNRTVVPSVSMRMRHEGRLEVGGGVRMECATLVVVRPMEEKGGGESEEEDVGLVKGAFAGGVYLEAVAKLVKSKSYVLKLNSF